MRHLPRPLAAALAVLAVACLLPNALATAPDTSRPLAGGASQFKLNLDHAAIVSLTITLQMGAFDSLDVQGPGSCVERFDSPGTTTFLTCGYLADGTYGLRIVARNGAMLGRIDVDGATFALH